MQFIAAADCNVDLGVNNPATFCQSNPIIITPIYKNGDPLLSGTSKTSNALLREIQVPTHLQYKLIKWVRFGDKLTIEKPNDYTVLHF